jgi:hypothetical protein
LLNVGFDIKKSDPVIEENNVSASVPGSLNDVLILPGNQRGGVAGMSEKCDLCHLKLAVFLNIIQALAPYGSAFKHNGKGDGALKPAKRGVKE